jgi:lipopolysaccharide export LptBFGC system permease protein LptF
VIELLYILVLVNLTAGLSNWLASLGYESHGIYFRNPCRPTKRNENRRAGNYKLLLNGNSMTQECDWKNRNRDNYPPVTYHCSPFSRAEIHTIFHCWNSGKILNNDNGKAWTQPSHWVELFQKLAYPAQLFLMVALGALLAATHHRQSKAAESLAIAVFLGIISWILNQIFLAVGHAGALPPFLAAWGNCLLFLVLILTLARWNQS